MAERFLPQKVGQLQDRLNERPWPTAEHRERFDALATLVAATTHFQFHQREQAVVDAWDAIGEDPDAAHNVATELGQLLSDANYTEVSSAELAEAMEKESLIPLRLEVDLDDYEELLIQRRGERVDTVEVKKLMGLATRQKSIKVDDRTVIYSRIKPESWFAERGVDPADRNLAPGSTSLKQFQNVPRADIEMLLPNTEVKFRTIDTLMLAVPAVVSGLIVLTTKLLPTILLIALVAGAAVGLREEMPNLDQAALLVLMGGLVTLGGFFFKQWSTMKNRRVNYLKTLSENLYFRTLGDGPGVLHTLLASAEQQEVAETIIAYRFLAEAPAGVSPVELDQRIETWLRASDLGDIDFDVHDALEKLEALDLLAQSGPTVAVLEPAEALVQLDRRWDALFRYPGSP